jgi:hypothetical protein
VLPVVAGAAGEPAAPAGAGPADGPAGAPGNDVGVGLVVANVSAAQMAGLNPSAVISYVYAPGGTSSENRPSGPVASRDRSAWSLYATMAPTTGSFLSFS